MKGGGRGEGSSVLRPALLFFDDYSVSVGGYAEDIGKVKRSSASIDGFGFERNVVEVYADFYYRAIDLKRDPEKLASSEGAPSKKRVCQAVRRKYHLTEREEEVLALLTDGYSRKAIAKELFVSENTVATHLRVIYAKMECHRKDEVVRLVKECEEEQRLKAS